MINRLIVTGDYIFTSSYDMTARCWIFDAPANRSNKFNPCLRVFSGHQKAVYPLIFIPTEDDYNTDPDLCDVLITGSADGTARSWGVETGKCLKVFKGHTGPIQCMSVDNDGRVLFTGSADNTIRSWLIDKGELIRLFEGHREPVICMTVRNSFLLS